MKEKQAQATQPIVIKAGERPDNSAIIAAREARKAQARAKQAELQQTNDAATVADPRKTAVEAAIARAKARKLEQQQANGTRRTGRSAQSRRRSRYCPCQSAQAGAATG
ncbi:hypothetical protein ECZU29_43740 [Escherichia coli]|nr:hypothetical protein ECZU29_43740 [Escherichia coli]